MTASKIEWTDRSDWNPIRGCTRVSPGCGGPGPHGGCYAEAIAARFSDPGQAFHGFAERTASGPRWTGRVELLEDRLTLPLRWRKPARIFASSTSDIFHESLPDEAIDKIFAVMALAPQHTFQILTKRAKRMREYMCDEQTPFRVARQIDALRAHPGDGKEELRPIDGYPGYFVSSHGHVYSEKRGKRRRLRPDAGDQGHLRVPLYREAGGRRGDRHLIHRLVLEAFVGPAPAADVQGRHQDGDPANNAVGNLLWGDQAKNWDDSKRHGSHRRYSKLTAEQANQIRARFDAGETAAALGREYGISDTQTRNIGTGKQWAVSAPIGWPLPNLWAGVSVEDQTRADERIPELLATPAAVRFISAEPLLSAIDLRNLVIPRRYGSGLLDAFTLDFKTHHQEVIAGPPKGHGPLDWVIAGGESGPKARPMRPDWARSLRDQCHAAGVPFFFKQWGEWHVPTAFEGRQDLEGQAPTPFVRVGKKDAGRLLDGREWNGMPG